MKHHMTGLHSPTPAELGINDISQYPFDEQTLAALAPTCYGQIEVGRDNSILGEAGRLVDIRLTRAELETVIKSYLRALRAADDLACYQVACPSTQRRAIYGNLRIGQFIDAGYISDERVRELETQTSARTDQFVTDQD